MENNGLQYSNRKYVLALVAIAIIVDLDFYVREGGVETDLQTNYSLVFSANGIIGNPAEPMVINFVSQQTHDYLMVTDASQLVAGRNYVVGCDNAGSFVAMGMQNGGKRAIVDITVAQHNGMNTGRLPISAIRIIAC